MSVSTKSICVIGCGVSGLVSIKSCLEEGHLVTCYEQFDRLGGTFNYSDKRKPNQGAGVFYRLHMNTSRETSRFSDFPMPDHYPPFLTWQMALSYLEDYAKQFDLLKHVEFNVEVTNVAPAEDYEVTGRWLVKTRSTSSCVEDSRVFDCVMITSGYFRKAFGPPIPGQGSFAGKITHSIDFRRGEEYAGKSVVLVGAGSSGSDIAIEVSLFARKVIFAVGDGLYVIPLFDGNNEPWDILINRRNCFYGKANMVETLKMAASKRLDHSRTGLAEPGSSGFAVSGNLGTFIRKGKIEVQRYLERLERSTAYFSGGVEAEVDHVIMATGFQADYPFLEKSVFPDNFRGMTLYKLVWPTCLKHPTLAVIGHFAAFGAAWPIMELQARWVARVFSGQRNLPNNTYMKGNDGMEDLVFPLNAHGSLKLFPVYYMDLVAEEIGCKPNILHSLFTDPVVAWKLFTGPMFPAQYRMQGPHRTRDARDQFLKGYDLTFNSPRRRELAKDTSQWKRTLYFAFGIMATVLLMWCCYKCI